MHEYHQSIESRHKRWLERHNVKRSKTYAADAEAIGEAVHRPTMRFVEIKFEDQQDFELTT